MKTTNDGGPAFPYGQKNVTERYSEGMSLRDYFAAQALTGLITNSQIQLGVVRAQCAKPGQENYLVGQCLARHCYDLADAMLQMRES